MGCKYTGFFSTLADKALTAWAWLKTLLGILLGDLVTVGLIVAFFFKDGIFSFQRY
jgi:hypothetical protein